MAVNALKKALVLEDEAISIRAIDPPTVSDKHRLEVLRGLEEYFAKVDAQRQPVSPEEADAIIAIIDEALRSTRPNYRPIRCGLPNTPTVKPDGSS